MPHKTREAIDEQQKQSGMEAEELLFELDQLRIKYKGYKPDIEESSPRIDESIDLINQFKRDILIERDSIWMDSIAHCDILTNDNIAEIKRAVSWHDKPHQNQNKQY